MSVPTTVPISTASATLLATKADVVAVLNAAIAVIEPLFIHDLWIHAYCDLYNFLQKKRPR